MAFNWENYRNADGSLDLKSALDDQCRGRQIKPADWRRACEFLDTVQELMPVRSRQAAAIALTRALEIAWG